MANPLEYRVDVLASSPEEIDRIAVRLKEPSVELVEWVVTRHPQDRSEATKNIRSLVGFEFVRNLFALDESVNKARRFSNSFKRWRGIVDSHLFEISEEFPAALFMVEFFDQTASYSGKFVLHTGKILRKTHDGNHHAQGVDWMLLDIFAPFRAEYELGAPFGSLWDEWVHDVIEAAQALRVPAASGESNAFDCVGRRLVRGS